MDLNETMVVNTHYMHQLVQENRDLKEQLKLALHEIENLKAKLELK